MNAFRKSIPSKKRANIGASRNARSNIGGREEKPLARHCESGAPERSRTSNRLIRSQILYPVELRVQVCSVYGIRTRDLRLERAMSWATRRTRQVLLFSQSVGPVGLEPTTQRL